MSMTPLEQYVGQILDDKYRLERLLGKGGMGAVYLATHLGTDRYVALKLIAPQFMRNEEFVERFKREARAAGRLRHPNVVDVTDFGFSGTGPQRVAYLVMEYLDGCTLSDVLDEETRLPLDWVVDILEQICSAVHEAHQQGIVHRDLKPDNIWLEPNGLGAYRVKVLDFGIAKLGEAAPLDLELIPAARIEDDIATQIPLAQSIPATMAAGAAESEAQKQPLASREVLEAATLINPPLQAEEPPSEHSDQATRMFPRARSTVADAGATALPSTHAGDDTSLTRVGAILGTPLYMSPEQCRGEHLDARSDIYSLGIITYQMLTGTPPFTGETNTIIRAHKELPITPIREVNKKVPKRVSKVLMSALEKETAKRPQTAMAFANAMRANADGLGTLYRRAFALYTGYFPEFLKLSVLAHIPVVITTMGLIALQVADNRLSKGATIAIGIPLGLLQFGAQFLAASVISGVTAIIVTQLAVMPMKPVRLREAFAILRQRWRPFLKTGIVVTLRVLLGWILLIIPGFIAQARYFLWAPVVLMEGLEKKEARQRARSLASRSWRATIIVMCVQLLIPAIVGSIIGAATGGMTTRKVHHGVTFKITSNLSGLVNIFILPLLAIVPALLYLKMRQFGGETLTEVMAQLQDLDEARSHWQQRMRSRLTVTPPSRTPTY
jgi:serine/threonine protein kinase